MPAPEAGRGRNCVASANAFACAFAALFDAEGKGLITGGADVAPLLCAVPVFSVTALCRFLPIELVMVYSPLLLHAYRSVTWYRRVPAMVKSDQRSVIARSVARPTLR